MALVTVPTYQAITGDTSTAASAVSARIEEATDLLEEALGRDLANATRTEVMHPTRDGSLWPRAIPITNGGGYTVEGIRLVPSSIALGSLVDDLTGGITVTYTGGWVERTANPTATNVLPRHMERDLAWAAYALQQTDQQRREQALPAGVVGMSLGDAQLQFDRTAPGRGQLAPSEANIVWSRQTMKYRYMRIGGPWLGRSAPL